MIVRTLLRTKAFTFQLGLRSFASQADPALHLDLFGDDAQTQELFQLALPQKGKISEPSTLPFPAPHYAEDIQQKLKNHGAAKLGSFHHFCDAISEKEQALLIPELLKGYRQRLIGTKERTASCVAKASCRVDAPEIALEVFSKRQEYALFPTVRCLNFLMYRFLLDSSANIEASKDAMKTYRLILHYDRTPNDLSREILFRSLFLRLEKEEKLEKLISLLSPQAELFASLPKKGLLELIQRLKLGKEKEKEKELLEKLREVVDLRKKYSEEVPRELALALSK